MSYDLFFRSRSPDRSVSQADFLHYFQDRPFYQLNELQAFYANEDSGVYFAFEYGDQSESSEEDGEVEESLLPLTFNLNYFRSHVFGLEAEPEVTAFVKHFDLTVSDPQTAGMGEGEYSIEGFLSGWNAGNEFGYRAMLSQDPDEPILTLPSSKIEDYWRWNRDREARQNQLGENVFVPQILFFAKDSVVRTCVAWADGIPILLPTVDVVLVPRQQLAPRRWFRSENKSDMVAFTWQELKPIVERFRCLPGGKPACYELFYRATPTFIEKQLRNKKPMIEKLNGVTLDRILDQELVEMARGSGK